jgi:hypothetical protein
MVQNRKIRRLVPPEQSARVLLIQLQMAEFDCPSDDAPVAHPVVSL